MDLAVVRVALAEQFISLPEAKVRGQWTRWWQCNQRWWKAGTAVASQDFASAVIREQDGIQRATGHVNCTSFSVVPAKLPLLHFTVNWLPSEVVEVPRL